MKERYQKQFKLMMRVLETSLQDGRVALKGGTAINVFYRNLPRYSVDIDLCYLPVEDRATTFRNIHNILKTVKSELRSRFSLNTHESHPLDGHQGSTAKLSVFDKSDSLVKIKIEPNYTIRGNLFPTQKLPLCSKVQEILSLEEMSVNCLHFAETFGGKICAALDRQHPRDLFDIKILLDNEGITEEIKDAFVFCLISSGRPINEILIPRIRPKEIRNLYKTKFEGMERENISPDELIKTTTKLQHAIMDKLSEKDRSFLKTFVRNEPDWSLARDDKIKKFPSVDWKLQKQREMNKEKHKKYVKSLKFDKLPDDRKYYQYWGKSKKDGTDYHLLAYHSLDVAAVGFVFLQNHPSLLSKLADAAGMEQKDFLSCFAFFLALHDMGKFAESFQNLNPSLFKELRGREGKKHYKERHDSLGWKFWEKYMKKECEVRHIIEESGDGIFQQNDRAADFWARLVVGHHGKPPGESSSRHLHDDFSQDDLAAGSEFLDDLIGVFGLKKEPWLEMKVDKIKRVSWWCAGLAVLSDWLGSNTDFFPYRKEQVHLSDHWKWAKDNAKEAIDKTEMLRCQASGSFNIKELLEEMTLATPLQQAVSQWKIKDSPHLFILEDVTGAGKTEAALVLAHKLMKKGQGDGLFFALPTMATSNTMYERMKSAYAKLFSEKSRPSLILAHGFRDMYEGFTETLVPLQDAGAEGYDYGDKTMTASAHCNSWLADNNKKSLLADVGVGTIDQALLSVLSSRHQSLRLFGMINKILIVDEVHAYDPYMNELLCSLLKFHSSIGGSVILLSATLPKAQRQKFLNSYSGRKSLIVQNEAYPLITSLCENKPQEKEISTRKEVAREVKVKFLSEKEELFDLVDSAINSGQCLCWIRNSVKDAIEAWKEIKERYPKVDATLFHAKFALGDRLAIEKKVVKKFGKESSAQTRKGGILVATQVVEQSLDLDFDQLITDLAPMDLVLQRAGRLHRHCRDKKGDRISSRDERGVSCVHIHSPPFEENPSKSWYKDFFPNSNKVYCNHGQLWLTARILQERESIGVPQDIRNLIEGVFGEGSEESIPESLQEMHYLCQGDASAERSHARMASLELEKGYSAEGHSWWDEGKTVTRLGDPTTTVYLAKWDKSKETLRPWGDGWPMSRISVRTCHAKEEDNDARIEPYKNELPDKGKWSLLLPLSWDEERKKWIGNIIGKNDRTYCVEYCSQSGLVIC